MCHQVRPSKEDNEYKNQDMKHMKLGDRLTIALLNHSTLFSLVLLDVFAHVLSGIEHLAINKQLFNRVNPTQHRLLNTEGDQSLGTLRFYCLFGKILYMSGI